MKSAQIDHLRRGNVDWKDLATQFPEAAAIAPRHRHAVSKPASNIEGYIARQDRQIERFAKMESKLIPLATDYSQITGLRNEARQKLTTFTPRSLGQALRISGITPADVTVLAIHLDRVKRAIPRGE